MSHTPFNWSLYIEKQTQAILDRLSQTNWLLYLEVGGHFLVDHHASRVLPGYIPNSKAQIFKNLAEHTKLSIIFCINARDVVRDRQFSQKYISFEKYLLNELETINNTLKTTPSICFTMLDHDFIPPHIRELEDKLQWQWYTTYHKYQIAGYPTNTDLILSPDGYGKDDHISVSSWITLVSACGSNSGKLNTCLSQLYLDHTTWTNSNYTKFETFPIRNLPLHHPINLAYEAATADIGDYNMIDPYYTDGSSINYNRDVEAFEVLRKFWEIMQINVSSSPTDMGINTAGFCLSDDEKNKKEISDACSDEIQSRIRLYEKLLLSWHGEEEAITKCEELLKYFK